MQNASPSNSHRQYSAGCLDNSISLSTPFAVKQGGRICLPTPRSLLLLTTMEVSLSDTLIDDTFKTRITQLPSWGQPILPEVIRRISEEINDNFPFTGETHLDPNLAEDDRDCPLRKMPDPFQVIQRDVECLWKTGEPQKRFPDEDSNGISEYIHEDSSFCSERDCVPREPCSTDTSDTTDTDFESEVEGNFPKAMLAASFAWAIEAQYDESQSLCFKLKASGGAYMILFKDEIIDSIQALLERMTNNITFKVQSIDGNAVLIDSSRVIATVAKNIKKDSRKRQFFYIERRDEYEDGGLIHSLSPPRKMFRIPSLRHRRQNDGIMMDKIKCHNRLRSARNFLSGSSDVNVWSLC